MFKFSLKARCSKIPNLNGTVFAAAIHPFAVFSEADCCDVGGVVVVGDDGLGGVGVYFVEADVGVASSGNERFVRCDFEFVYLAVGVLQCAVTYSRGGFPESVYVVKDALVRFVKGNRERGAEDRRGMIPDCVIIACCSKYHCRSHREL